MLSELCVYMIRICCVWFLFVFVLQCPDMTSPSSSLYSYLYSHRYCNDIWICICICICVCIAMSRHDLSFCLCRYLPSVFTQCCFLNHSLFQDKPARLIVSYKKRDGDTVSLFLAVTAVTSPGQICSFHHQIAIWICFWFYSNHTQTLNAPPMSLKLNFIFHYNILGVWKNML